MSRPQETADAALRAYLAATIVHVRNRAIADRAATSRAAALLALNNAGMSQAAIATRTGLTTARVNQLITKARTSRYTYTAHGAGASDAK